MPIIRNNQTGVIYEIDQASYDFFLQNSPQDVEVLDVDAVARFQVHMIMTMISYADLKDLKDNDQLVPLNYYLIEDATAIGNAVVVPAGIPLIVQAVSENQISSAAMSPDYAQDSIGYNFDTDTIVFRKDNYTDIAVHQDLRNLSGLSIGSGCSNIYLAAGVLGSIGNNCTNIRIGIPFVSLSVGNNMDGILYQEKNVVCPELFGALRDGVSDDRTAINNALLFINTLGGGKVMLNIGTYLVSDRINIYDQTTLQGLGQASIIKSTLINGDLVCNKNYGTTNYNYNVHVKDLLLDMQHTTNNGVVFGGVSVGSIENVTVKDPHGYGIWILRSGDNLVPSTPGIPSQYIKIYSCHVSGVEDVGIELYGCNYCEVDMCTVSGIGRPQGGTCYYIWNGARNNIVSNCIALSETPDDMTNQINGFGYQPSDLYPTTLYTRGNMYVNCQAVNTRLGYIANNVDGNSFVNCNALATSGDASVAGAGLSIQNSYDIDFGGGRVEGFYTALQIDKVTAGATFGLSRDIKIYNNRFIGGQESVIYGTGGLTFTGNTVEGTNTNGISLYGVSNGIFQANILKNIGNTAGNIGLFFRDYTDVSTVYCTYNTIVGNSGLDTRVTKNFRYVIGLTGGSANNSCTGNIGLTGRPDGIALRFTDNNCIVANYADASNMPIPPMGLNVPAMTTTQQNALVTAGNTNGITIYPIIFNTTTGKHRGYDGTNWNDLY